MWSATLIPFAAVPISLIGTFAGLHLLGYSINTLTLFGMVLSIGMMLCLGLMGAGWFAYWLAYALWGPG